MADTSPFVAAFNQQYQDLLNGKSSIPDPFKDVATNPDTDKLIQGLPSLGVGAALNQLGKSQYGPFGSYLMSNLGPNLNNIFEAITPMNSANDNPAGRRQFYMNYVAGLYDPNSPLNFNYNDVGSILKDALSGASDTEFSNTLRMADPSGQAGAIADFIKGFGATTMSSTKVNLITAQLGQMLQDYTNRGLNGSLDPGSTSFVQYLVQRSADFLDRFFGGQNFAGITPITGNDFSDTQANLSGAPVGPGAGANGVNY